MANKKKKRGKQGLMSKLLNVGGVLIGLARPIEILINQGFTNKALQVMLEGFTFGLSEGSFQLEPGLKMYAPVGAAVGYRELTKYLVRHFPVR